MALETIDLLSFLVDPNFDRRNWTDNRNVRDTVIRDRCRSDTERGKRLSRQRGKLLERPIGLLCDTGVRRIHLRGHHSLLKRMLHMQVECLVPDRQCRPAFYPCLAKQAEVNLRSLAVSPRVATRLGTNS